MQKTILSLIVCLTLQFAGCNGNSTTSNGSDQCDFNIQEPNKRDKVLPSAGSPTVQRLVIDVRPEATIGGVVRSIFQDSNGVLWVGGKGDLFRNDGKTITSYDIKDDLGNGVTVKQIIESKDGVIWFATTGGITRIDGPSFKSFGDKDGLISRDVWSIAADKEGMLWIGTIDGICRFDGNSFSEFAIPESKPDPTRGVTSAKIVHCIMVDKRDHVWFGTNGGAYVYNGKALDRISSRIRTTACGDGRLQGRAPNAVAA